MCDRFILDCTLRDGGYVNNWEFDTETARGIIAGIYQSGIRNIELGIMGSGAECGKQTKFSDFREMELLLNGRKADCRYFVMLNQAEFENYDIPPRSEYTPDCIRLAFFKKERQAAVDDAVILMDKGYQVFLQAMATFMYSEAELGELLSEINRIKPAAFYMVDSFGMMFNEDVKKMADFVCSNLSEDILFGFHAHNNIQMAFSNTMTFLKADNDRDLISDSSIYGMGRGAGNVPTELLMWFLNTNYGATYDITAILQTFDKYMRSIFIKYFWGYSMEYFLTASKEINSAYGWYLSTRHITDLKEMNDIFDRIPPEIRYTLSKEDVNAAIDSVKHEKEKPE